jgi:hypothetical protein
MRCARAPHTAPHPYPPHPLSQELAFLAGVVVVTAACLSSAYAGIAQSRLDGWVASRSNRAAGSAGDIGAEFMWKSIFQTNFWFFVIFGTLQHGVLPQVLLAVDPSFKYTPLVQGGLAVAIPALGAYAVGRGAF